MPYIACELHAWMGSGVVQEDLSTPMWIGCIHFFYRYIAPTDRALTLTEPLRPVAPRAHRTNDPTHRAIYTAGHRTSTTAVVAPYSKCQVLSLQPYDLMRDSDVAVDMWRHVRSLRCRSADGPWTK